MTAEVSRQVDVVRALEHPPVLAQLLVASRSWAIVSCWASTSIVSRSASAACSASVSTVCSCASVSVRGWAE
jgi:hypothetical protein